VTEPRTFKRQSIQRTILVATTNPGKVRELRAMLGDGIEWKSLADFPGVGEVKEDGSTFAENARKKAAGYAGATGLWTLADDSGLVVDALGGAPGVNSARFSGERAKGVDRKVLDRRNMEKLLSLLEGVPAEKRTARFVCCLCLASPEKILVETQGTLEGLITHEPAGTGGFGYDPVFLVPQLGKTVAQLGEEEKNAISHRGNAMRKLKPLLSELVQGGHKMG
jgi:XTP/dITP diphosphohydrolase